MAKTTITTKEVERIAKLARLGLTKAEIKQATKDLSDVLGHFSQIQSIDTTDTPTSDDVTGLTNVTREDKPSQDNLCDTQTLLDNAPDTHGGQIKVKSVFD